MYLNRNKITQPEYRFKSEDKQDSLKYGDPNTRYIFLWN